MEETKNIFKSLSEISVKDKIDKKGKHSYISWANSWGMLKLEYPEAQRIIYESEHTGLNFFTDGKTAYVKVGIIVEDLEHIDNLPVMDFRNKSIPMDKITSMDINTSIQRSTAKAIAMHGLGLSLWIGEDNIQIMNPAVAVKQTPVPTFIELNIGDENFAKVLKYVADNKELGLPKIVKKLEGKYKIKSLVKKELAKYIK
tara:strand:+ start:1589 stop:2188 length:600 start_codon:yes stop_codon:yes gene_type:complete